ncbi:MAG: peptidylprolyl isomerase [Oceanispirochaeta sp.]|nr:peptidylprolyl isomerase [Oceanispirochaeta sp.]
MEKKVSTISNSEKERNDKSRKRQKKLMTGTIVILVFTIISFVLVPAMAGSSRNSGSMVFGKYGGKMISFKQGNYFSQQVESVNNMYRDSMGGTGNVDFLRQLIWRSAFNQTVVRTAILEEMNVSGMNVSSTRIDRGIVESGMFSSNNRFDETAYLNTTATRLKEIRTSLAEDLTVQTYYLDTIYNQKRSSQMMDFLLDMGNPEKNFAYASFPYSSFPEEQIKAYGNENAKLFEEISLKRITIKSKEDEAATILKKLEAGEQSFEDLAKTYSKDSYAEDGGTMGSTFKYTLLSFLNEEQASSVMSLASGTHSTLINSDGSWYIFMAETAATSPDFSSVALISTIRSYMEREEVGIIEDFLMGKAEEMALLAHTSNLSEAAAQFGSESGETGFIAPVYGSVPFIVNSPGNKKDSSLLSAAAFSDEFFEKVFVLKTPGETSQPMVLDRSVVVFSLLEEQKGFSYPDEYKDYIRTELGNELSQYKQSQLQNIFMASPKFKDNFTSTYNRVFTES